MRNDFRKIFHVIKQEKNFDLVFYGGCLNDFEYRLNDN